jgi:hypothetical protein
MANAVFHNSQIQSAALNYFVSVTYFQWVELLQGPGGIEVAATLQEGGRRVLSKTNSLKA